MINFFGIMIFLNVMIGNYLNEEMFFLVIDIVMILLIVFKVLKIILLVLVMFVLIVGNFIVIYVVYVDICM